MDTIKTEQTVTHILSEIHDCTLSKEHPQQRYQGVWDKSQRDGLLGSIIKGEDVGVIVICEQWDESNNTLSRFVIDGNQRLTELENFIFGGKKHRISSGDSVEYPIVHYSAPKRDTSGKIIINPKTGMGVMESAECDIRGKSFDELPPELQKAVRGYQFTVVTHRGCTDEEVGYHIRRYNHCKPMTTAQKQTTYVDVTVAKKVKDLAAHPFFETVGKYPATVMKNGDLERILMDSLLAFNVEAWRRGSAEKLAKLVMENTTDETYSSLENYLDRLSEIIPGNLSEETEYKWFNKKNSFLTLALFHRFSKMGVEDKFFAYFLSVMGTTDMMEKEVNGTTYAALEENRATKDRKVVSGKLDLLEELLREFVLQNGCEIASETSEDDFEREDNEQVDAEEEFVVDECAHPEVLEDFINEFSEVETINTYSGGIISGAKDAICSAELVGDIDIVKEPNREKMEDVSADTVLYAMNLDSWAAKLYDEEEMRNIPAFVGLMAWADRNDISDSDLEIWLKKNFSYFGNKRNGNQKEIMESMIDSLTTLGEKGA